VFRMRFGPWGQVSGMRGSQIIALHLDARTPLARMHRICTEAVLSALETSSCGVRRCCSPPAPCTVGSTHHTVTSSAPWRAGERMRMKTRCRFGRGAAGRWWVASAGGKGCRGPPAASSCRTDRGQRGQICCDTKITSRAKERNAARVQLHQLHRQRAPVPSNLSQRAAPPRPFERLPAVLCFCLSLRVLLAVLF
jgi:hypothetical protein